MQTPLFTYERRFNSMEKIAHYISKESLKTFMNDKWQCLMIRMHSHNKNPFYLHCIEATPFWKGNKRQIFFHPLEIIFYYYYLPSRTIKYRSCGLTHTNDADQHIKVVQNVQQNQKWYPAIRFFYLSTYQAITLHLFAHPWIINYRIYFVCACVCVCLCVIREQQQQHAPVHCI